MVISLYAVPTLLYEVHTLLNMMVVASIICGTFCIMYDGYIIICGAYFIICCAYSIVCSAFFIIRCFLSGSFVIM